MGAAPARNGATASFEDGPIPPRAGVGLKPQHYREILASEPDIGWFEVHAENYMGAGGPPHHYLEAIRERYPLSLHGVGLSIGGAGDLDGEHLARLKGLIERYAPALFSEHLAWSTHDNVYLNDLLPLPYTEATLAHVCEHVEQVQEVLATRMLLENPSTYVAFSTSDMSEIEFLKEVVRRTGCGLLLDVNNVFVQATTTSTRTTISTCFQWTISARSILAAMRRMPTTTALPVYFNAHARCAGGSLCGLSIAPANRKGASLARSALLALEF